MSAGKNSITVIKLIEGGAQFAKQSRVPAAELALDVRVEQVQLLDWREGGCFLFHFWVEVGVDYLEELLDLI